jgi:hypothetical protein
MIVWVISISACDGVRRRRIAGRVVVNQDQCSGGKLERALDDLARIDRCVIDSADLLQFVDDQLIALVEEQHAKLFLFGKGHGRAAVIDHARP